ncbi:peptidogalycan biosysnthesis protein [Gayadomonas joobiniege]|uniref:peptidogalycan biosysnthesis protein n=1 Tax=Gayadomonas joobiniege TaxID=1234606 RepID=UPI00037838B5|nr:peptidogalycan biosysnthesis protein [Gayadomonas joobiniege]
MQFSDSPISAAREFQTSLPENWCNPQQLAFLKKEFLSALEQTACINGHTGWQGAYCQPELGYLPCFIKTHSRGEYVFDHALAEAYYRYGVAYYPKLLCAIPFTPVPIDKFKNTLRAATDAADVAAQFEQSCRQHQLSGWQANFVSAEQASWFKQAGAEIRYGVQFEWYNQNFSDFADFVDLMRARKRKNLLKERLKAQQSVDDIRILNGQQIDTLTLADFYQCYQLTYLKRGQKGYLSLQFFKQVCETMYDNVCLIAAFKQNRLVAGAFYFIDHAGLYGRYWGALEDLPFLHFELCYYQGITLAIQKQLPRFNPGTQGEHKIARGFTPVYTHSVHSLIDPRFKSAFADFCNSEKTLVDEYFLACTAQLPFK